MNRILFKEFLRALKNNLSRFISIVAIIALGVGFFAGISATKNDMVLSATKYYNQHNLMDLRSMNPLGYKEEELKKVNTIENIEYIEQVFRQDIFVVDNDTRLVTRVFSMDASQKNGLNQLYLVEGRLPENSKEIVVSNEKYNGVSFSIGATVKFDAPEDLELNDILKTNEFTVVGRFESPLYVSYEKEQTNVGSGKVQLVAYILKEDWAYTKPSELFIRVKDTKQLVPTSQDYKDRVEAVKSELESIGSDFMLKETAALRKTLEDNRNELQRNKDKANEELLEAQQKLEQAELDISEGELTLAREEAQGRKKIADGRRDVANGRSQLLDGRLKYNAGYLKWSKSYNEYESAKFALDSSKMQLDSARMQLDSTKQLLEQSKATLDSSKQQLDMLKQAIDALDTILSRIPETPQLTEEQYREIVDSIRVYSPETADYIETYLPYETPGISVLIKQFVDRTIGQLKTTYNTSKAQYDEGLKQYEAGLKQYQEGEKEYQEGLKQYKAGKAKLDAGKKELDQGKRQLDNSKKKLDDSEAKLNQAAFELDEGQRELEEKIAEGKIELENAKLEFEEGKAKFESEKADILRKLQEADDELLKAERKIADIPENWFIYNRDNNPDYTSWFDNADKIGQVALVFPAFFFLVAALVTLTNITRMVEEERTQMGTLKALGYQNNALASKFILYAFSASIIGSLLGLAIGFTLFPSVIINAYRLMYNMPYLVLEFNWFFGLLSIGFALVAAIGAALAAIFTEIYGKVPAQLMQPKSPAAGKRIFLERLTFLWKRISFSHKVTFRNLFLYKKRFWMTVIGIAGCTALVLTGFGIKNSVDVIASNQFNNLFVYDGFVILDDKRPAEERKAEDILRDQSEIAAYKVSLSKSMKVHQPNSDRLYDATLIVPESLSGLENFIVLRDRVSKTAITLNDDGLILNEKLADTLKLKVGDTLYYEDVDKRQYQGEIVAITENYVNNYIYMTPAYYQRQHLMKPDYNGIWINYSEKGLEQETQINESILENEAVVTIVSTKHIAASFNDQLKSLNYVVLVLVISAAALAFIVLYNLSKVNITERQRELATIKVLGFRDFEVTAYVYRESNWLSIIGSALGLLLGFFLHRYIMVTLEIDNLMFGKEIHWLSYIISVVLTLIFSFFVSLIMHFELKRINMVEALKSIE